MKVWTSLELLRWTTSYFEENGIASARLDAEVLLAHVLGIQRIELYVQFEKPVTEAERATFREMIRRRVSERIPVAYLIGSKEFWSQSFHVTPDVLIPRPETELLVRCARERRPRRVAEIGVGSGCVTGVLALELPEAEFVAVDASPEALEVARLNLEALGVSDRVELQSGDLLNGVVGDFDLVLSNPPYVPTGDLEGLEPELAREPRLALDGGPDGLDVIRRLIPQAAALLADGWLSLEIGAGQAAAVTALLNDCGAKEVEAHRDLAGIERVVEARFQLSRGG
jgi:release factor glutamine methyltransferase